MATDRHVIIRFKDMSHDDGIREELAKRCHHLGEDFPKPRLWRSRSLTRVISSQPTPTPSGSTSRPHPTPLATTRESRASERYRSSSASCARNTTSASSHLAVKRSATGRDGRTDPAPLHGHAAEHPL